ncbi:hypothetical protein MHH81_12095 [Psychrobacillus sp. FSL H8-0484]|uniref:hypothetical protein n=1 Tax=Psychrobacillus sp. FSL H8-0484 TaxID=2921390 RepID=UPI0030FB856D
MRLIASTPNQKRNAYKFSLMIITIMLILVIPSCIRYIKADSTNSQLTDYIKTAAFELLEKDKAISDFVIDSLEFSHKTEESEEVYKIMYSMKPADPKNFVLEGSGKKGEEGWIHERVNYVTVKKNRELTFSTNP